MVWIMNERATSLFKSDFVPICLAIWLPLVVFLVTLYLFTYSLGSTRDLILLDICRLS